MKQLQRLKMLKCSNMGGTGLFYLFWGTGGFRYGRWLTWRLPVAGSITFVAFYAAESLKLEHKLAARKFLKVFDGSVAQSSCPKIASKRIPDAYISMAVDLFFNFVILLDAIAFLNVLPDNHCRV